MSVVNMREPHNITEREKLLFSVLLQSTSFNGNEAIPVPTINTKKEQTVLRVAGGWVRDKLLGRESHDIDIAIDNQSGVQFATNLNAYLASIGMEVRTLAVISANPDQSKHLETANVRVMGFEIDCVNLRSESYTDETRIPTMEIGTAFEDAQRRDFTINALFYNLNTKTIEDLTGMGLNDLRDRIIRTPIDAHCTFKDDPLRVLRAVRFASRLNYMLEETLEAAARNDDIRSALLVKVSRERVYKECDGFMIPGGRPFMGLDLLFHLGLLGAVLPVENLLVTFPPATGENGPKPQVRGKGGKGGSKGKGKPDNLDGDADDGALCEPVVDLLIVDGWQIRSMRTVYCLNFLLNCFDDADGDPICTIFHRAEETVEEYIRRYPKFDSDIKLNVDFSKVVDYSKVSRHYKGVIWAAIISGVGQVMVREKKRVLLSPLTSIVLREGLKMETVGVKSVQTLLDCMCRFLLLEAKIFGKDLDEKEHEKQCKVQSEVAHSPWFREEAGMLLRVCKEQWRECLLLTCANRLATFSDEFPFSSPSAIVSRYKFLLQLIHCDLDGIWLAKPVLDGAKMISALGLSPKQIGPLVGRLLDQQVRWQLRQGYINIVDTSTSIQFRNRQIQEILKWSVGVIIESKGAIIRDIPSRWGSKVTITQGAYPQLTSVEVIGFGETVIKDTAIKEIEAKSGARIQIDQEFSVDKINITGTQQAVILAIQLVENAMSETGGGGGGEGGSISSDNSGYFMNGRSISLQSATNECVVFLKSYLEQVNLTS